MLKIAKYVRAQSPEEAYTLCQKRNNVILGGMLWLKMQNKNVDTAIDLCDLGLDKIEETEDSFIIGAMVSLRALEVHPALAEYTNGAMAEALRHIVGVQFRNTATLGGSIYGRFGFSDVLTVFEALEAQVELYSRGVIPVAEFAGLPMNTRDLLLRIIIPKKPRKTVYMSQRNTKTDFPSLTCCVSKTEDGFLCAIGARPGKAVVFCDREKLLADGITEAAAADFGNHIAEQAEFESNLRGSAEYRRKICAVLVRRCLMKLKEL